MSAVLVIFPNRKFLLESQIQCFFTSETRLKRLDSPILGYRITPGISSAYFNFFSKISAYFREFRVFLLMSLPQNIGLFTGSAYSRGNTVCIEFFDTVCKETRPLGQVFC